MTQDKITPVRGPFTDVWSDPQLDEGQVIPQKQLDIVHARAKSGALAELESLLWFRERVEEWKAEKVLMQCYRDYSKAMMIATDTLRAKMAQIRNYSADDLERWLENGAGFFHLETANTLAEIARKTPKQLMDEAVDLGNEKGETMTVDEMTVHALGEKKLDPAFFRVNAVLSRLGKFPTLLKWDEAKRKKFESLMDEIRNLFV
jgi:hypothetical protein